MGSLGDVERTTTEIQCLTVRKVSEMRAALAFTDVIVVVAGD
jgi:hypothetical protein